MRRFLWLWFSRLWGISGAERRRGLPSPLLVRGSHVLRQLLVRCLEGVGGEPVIVPEVR